MIIEQAKQRGNFRGSTFLPMSLRFKLMLIVKLGPGFRRKPKQNPNIPFTSPHHPADLEIIFCKSAVFATPMITKFKEKLVLFPTTFHFSNKIAIIFTNILFLEQNNDNFCQNFYSVGNFTKKFL